MSLKSLSVCLGALVAMQGVSGQGPRQVPLRAISGQDASPPPPADVPMSPDAGTAGQDAGAYRNMDQCAPSSNGFDLNSGERLPPCVAEFLIAAQCAQETKALVDKTNSAYMKALRDCLFGPSSTYLQNQDCCLNCKRDNGLHSAEETASWRNAFFEARKNYTESETPTEYYWDIIQDLADSGNAPEIFMPERLPKPKLSTIEDYCPNLTMPQRTGDFILPG